MEQRTLTPPCGTGVWEARKTLTGHILTGPLTTGKKVSFTVQPRYMGVTVTDKMVGDLCAGGHTEPFLVTQHGGQHGYGCLVIGDHGVTVEMERHYLRGRCPVCGGRVIRTSHGYCCEHYHEDGCAFHALGILAHRAITEQEMEDFLAGRPAILDGFRTDDDKPFSGFLVLNAQKMLAVCSRICRCPVCGGMLYVRPNGFRCERYRDPDNPCKTFYYRHYGGVALTREIMEELARDGHTGTPIVFLRDDGRRYPGQLVLNDSKSRINIIQL